MPPQRSSTQGTTGAGGGGSAGTNSGWHKVLPGPRAAVTLPKLTKSMARKHVTPGMRCLRRVSRSLPVPSVDALTWVDGELDAILVIGNSSFPHLEQLLTAMNCGAVLHNTMSVAPSSATRSGGPGALSVEVGATAGAGVPGGATGGSVAAPAAGPAAGHNGMLLSGGAAGAAGVAGGGGGSAREVNGGTQTDDLFTVDPLSRAYDTATSHAANPGGAGFIPGGAGDAGGEGVNGGAKYIPALPTSPFTVVPQAAHRYKGVRRSRVIIMDPVGPTETQSALISTFLGVTHLKASPLELADCRKLHLPHGCMVRAVVLPNLSSLDESAAMGDTACTADAECMCICSNLRLYCEYVGATVEIWTEAILPLYVSFLLPLCTMQPPYTTGADTSHGRPAPGSSGLPHPRATNDGRLRVHSPSPNPSSYAGAAPGPFPTEGGAHAHMQGVSPHLVSHVASLRRRGGGDVPNPTLSQVLWSLFCCASGDPGEVEPGGRSTYAGAAAWKAAQRRRAKLASVQVQESPEKPGGGGSVGGDDEGGLLPPLEVKFMADIRSRTRQMKAEGLVADTVASNPGLAPTLAPGYVFSGPVIDKVFCQLLFNPLLIQITSKLLGVWNLYHEDSPDTHPGGNHTLAFASTPLPTPIPVLTPHTRPVPTHFPGSLAAASAPVFYVSMDRSDGVAGGGAGAQQHLPAVLEHDTRSAVLPVVDSDPSLAADVWAFPLPRAPLPEQPAQGTTAPQHRAVGGDAVRLYLLPVHELMTGLRGCSCTEVDWEALRPVPAGLEASGRLNPEQEQMMTPGKLVPTWSHVFLQCLDNGILAMALYRRDIISGYMYVYTAPDRDTVLRYTDEVYFLASDVHLPPVLL